MPGSTLAEAVRPLSPDCEPGRGDWTEASILTVEVFWTSRRKLGTELGRSKQPPTQRRPTNRLPVIVSFWRRRPDLNRGGEVLQTGLGYLI